MANTLDVRITLPWWRMAMAYGAAHMVGTVSSQVPPRWVEAMIAALARWGSRGATVRMVQ
ncbi:hypothetical protein M2324_001642 [Rhodovulum sulfidophilum]|uniref:hypothetical protein n=1 Tax=Rhodovulum sulfidophilum TaxID=35806 RepID=UPI0005A63BC9|nr:hypothetical protein [Rhodovulum sulfidophilum]ANB32749.1 hypothetical protein A6W98_00855 [Rhodovulum sulfidophilum DSM 1374]ANB36598.1 hypothetical protein A6024_00840 [Rhodovulum sulfidophilum]MCW2303249.1 hypothetical protein [Rhodovulum sulfidophilum]